MEYFISWITYFVFCTEINDVTASNRFITRLIFNIARQQWKYIPTILKVLPLYIRTQLHALTYLCMARLKKFFWNGFCILIKLITLIFVMLLLTNSTEWTHKCLYFFSFTTNETKRNKYLYNNCSKLLEKYGLCESVRKHWRTED